MDGLGCRNMDAYVKNCMTITQQLVDQVDPMILEALHVSIDCGAALEMTQKRMEEIYPERFGITPETNVVSLQEWKISKGKV